MEAENGDASPRLRPMQQHEQDDATAPTHNVHATINAADPPPFWTRHGRSESSVSYQSISHLRPPPISLEDHSEDDSDQGRGCWAKHATVDDYVVVSGATGIGAYVVWNCTIETIKGAPFTIRKRYATDMIFAPLEPLILILLKATPNLMTYATTSFKLFLSS